MRWYAVTKWLLCMDTGREGTVYVAYMRFINHVLTNQITVFRVVVSLHHATYHMHTSTVLSRPAE